MSCQSPDYLLKVLLSQSVIVQKLSDLTKKVRRLDNCTKHLHHEKMKPFFDQRFTIYLRVDRSSWDLHVSI